MILIVLPAYNEEENLGALLGEIKYHMEDSGLSYKVIVIDDGSTDRSVEVTEKVAQELSISIVIVKHPQNRGLAETIKTGLVEAVKISGEQDIIVTMDADNTHTPGLILRMQRMIREGFDVAIASRYLQDSRVIGVPFFRQILSLGASMVCRIMFPIKGVRDYTSGYRAYKAGVLKKMFDNYGQHFIDQSGFTCMIDILLKMRKYPFIIGEAPLILRYDMKHSTSKMNVRKTVIDTLILLFKRRFAR
jgi:dolichol-phosphate mannosyltransferase